MFSKKQRSPVTSSSLGRHKSPIKAAINDTISPIVSTVRTYGIMDGTLHFHPYSITSINSSSLAPRFSYNPFVRGPIIGMNRLSHTAFQLSTPLYYPDHVTNPSMLVFGQIGQRKSTFVKIYALRHSYFGVPPYIIDPKGEYDNFAKSLGIPIVNPSQDGLTPLAKVPGLGAIDQAVKRAEFLEALVELYQNRPLTLSEQHAILGLCKRLDNIDLPILDDVISRAASNDITLPPELDPAPMPQALSNIVSALVLCRDELGHVLNVRPNAQSQLARTSGLVVDISEWKGESRRFPAILMSAMAWLTPQLYTPRAKLLVLDEAWAALRYEPFVRWLQSNLKLARSYALSTILVTHSPRNLGSQSATGTASSKIAESLLTEFGTFVVFHLPHEDLRTLTNYQFQNWELDWIADSRVTTPGSAYVKLGELRGLLDMLVTEDELRICDTDVAMRSAVI